MNLPLVYKDAVTLLETGANGWGDETIIHVEHLMGLFHEGTSQSHSGYVDNIASQAHCYLDINNQFVQENAFRLEGMYLIANLYGGREKESWYKIDRVVVGQRKLLENDINCCHVFLQKVEALDDWES